MCDASGHCVFLHKQHKLLLVKMTVQQIPLKSNLVGKRGGRNKPADSRAIEAVVLLTNRRKKNEISSQLKLSPPSLVQVGLTIKNKYADRTGEQVKR